MTFLSPKNLEMSFFCCTFAVEIIQGERSGPEFLGFLANIPAPRHTTDTLLTLDRPCWAQRNSLDAKSRFYRPKMQSKGGDFRVISVSFLCD